MKYSCQVQICQRSERNLFLFKFFLETLILHQKTFQNNDAIQWGSE